MPSEDGPSPGFRVIRQYLSDRERELSGLRFALTGRLDQENADEAVEGGDLRPSERTEAG
jgi:hypothetical protein